MSNERKPATADVHGKWWGARAEDWAAVQEGMVRPAFEAVLARTKVGPGTRYLDAGCGSGMAAQMAAALGATVHGLDATEPLLAIARRRVPSGDFRHGDLESLPFADGSFDVVTGFNAFQFAGNPGVALSEAKRVTRAGGTIAILTWGPPEGMEAAGVVGALRPLLPPPPPGAPGPFALSDEKALRDFATASGLTPVEVFDIDSPYVYPDEATALRGLNSSGVATRAIELVGEAAVSAAHAKAIAPYKRADGSYRLSAMFRCLLARA